MSGKYAQDWRAAVIVKHFIYQLCTKSAERTVAP